VIVSINQPAYLPWLGYFHRIAVSDVHVVLDHVQFEKNSFTNRNKIRTKEGWCWLTVPVTTKGLFGQLRIDRLECADDDGRWQRKHWAALRMNYGRASHFGRYAAFLEDAYSKPWARMNALLRALTQHLCEALEIRRPILFSSDLRVGGVKDELVLNICRAVEATTYLSGPLGRKYLREDQFRAAGIEVVYHDYRHPIYRQVFPGFEPSMSAVDLLFNCGPESRAILMRDQEVVRS
jgi:hypothetical protein